MSRIGDKIKEERIKKGLSPKQLARKCGVAESFIIDVETGKKIISEQQLKQLSKILGKNLEEDVTLEPTKEKEETKPKKVQPSPQKRPAVVPLNQWEEALSNIIKKVPIFDIDMKQIKGYKSFPIINRKVEGFNPDKLVYIEVPDEKLNPLRIHKGDKVLIYLNKEFVHNSLALVEYEGKKKLRKIKRAEGNKVKLITSLDETKTIIKDLKDIKIIGRGIRIEIELKH
ncbi:helix-turn-helix domain-containing protein [Crassaminicella thermophila]|nr:helix-turn-helix transcriptional regulator [Crassaminicella thermophila]